MPSLSVVIPGHARPKSVRVTRNGSYNSPLVKAWMKHCAETIKVAMMQSDYQPAPEGVPVALMVDVWLDRPKNTKKALREVEDQHTVRPDLDNLMKPLKDALTTAGAYHDDSQVSQEYAEKKWCKRGDARVELKVSWIKQKEHPTMGAPHHSKGTCHDSSLFYIPPRSLLVEGR